MIDLPEQTVIGTYIYKIITDVDTLSAKLIKEE